MSFDILNLLANTELLLTSLTSDEWKEWARDHRGQNIFFGMGIMTHTAISQAVPFDVLSMFFVAEALRKAVDAPKVFVLIADQHALTNQVFPVKDVQTLATKTLTTTRSIVQNFNLSHFDIIQTTTLNSNDDIRAIYQNLPQISNDYLKHEIADTLWLQKFHQVGIKVGWAMSTEPKVEGHDERFFDAQITQFCHDVSFIHTKPGRTARPERQRVSPYVSIAGEDRLLLNEDENAQEKLALWRQSENNSAIKPLIRHLSQILRLHDKLFGSEMFLHFEEKLQLLINKSTNGRK